MSDAWDEHLEQLRAEAEAAAPVLTDEELALKAALDALELPDSEPVEGWTYLVPHDRNVFEWRKNYHGQWGWELNSECRDWADISIKHPFWVLGEAVTNTPFGKQKHIEVFFTDENDFFMFKMLCEGE